MIYLALSKPHLTVTTGLFQEWFASIKTVWILVLYLSIVAVRRQPDLGYTYHHQFGRIIGALSWSYWLAGQHYVAASTASMQHIITGYG